MPPEGPSSQRSGAIAAKADAIDAEMKRLGVWQPGPLAPEKARFTQAFGMDTMAFTEWLQFVFLPRVRECLETGDFPASSQVGVQAIREFDGWDEVSDLVSLLCEFDILFNDGSLSY